MSSVPKLYVLIPVFNRLTHTRAIITCLRRQKGVDVQMIIIDDGSTDGTFEFLTAQEDVITLKGNGQLWWSGAIHLALKTIHPLLREGDFFVFMNNDTEVDENFLSVLATTSLANGRAVVGSVVRRAAPPGELLSIGPTSDLWAMAIWDVLRDVPESERHTPQETYTVDFLPGRGSLYPGEVLDYIGYMRPHLLPHYHADYEFADRVRRSGFKLLVASKAVTYSTEGFGNEQKPVTTFWRRKLGKGSPENVLHRVILFCLIGSPIQRLTAIPRTLLLTFPVRSLICGPIGRRLSIILFLPFSSIARAKLAAALERRGQQRKEALQVYVAALLKELTGSRVLLNCAVVNRYAPFFKRLYITTEIIDQLSDDARAETSDFLFCVIGDAEAGADLPEPEQLVKLVRPGGVIFCASEAQASPCWSQLAKSRLVAMPTTELLVDALTDGPPAGSMASSMPKGTFTELNLRFFAVRKLH